MTQSRTDPYLKARSLHLARFVLPLILAAMSMGLLNPSVSGQAPVIESLSQNGELTCTNLLPGSVATVLEAATVTGPWTTNADSIPVTSNGTFQLSGLLSTTGAKYYQVRGEPKLTVPTNMVLIPAGEFRMGSVSDGQPNELPVHTVYVSAFYMDRTEVTKAQWDEVYQWAIEHGYSFDNSGSGKAADHPVHSINWYDAVKWCNARSEREGRPCAYYTDSGLSQLTQPYRTGRVSPYVRWDTGYRLPTEAEWEKTARGGLSGKRFPWGDTITVGGGVNMG